MSSSPPPPPPKTSWARELQDLMGDDNTTDDRYPYPMPRYPLPINAPNPSEAGGMALQTPAPLSFGAIPSPGKFYMIRPVGRPGLLTLKQGNVVLELPVACRNGEGWRWRCAEKGNWLGFCNHTSGTFLGLYENRPFEGHCVGYLDDHFNFKLMHASSRVQGPRESFAIQHHALGGYVLLSPSSTPCVGLGPMSQVCISPDDRAVSCRAKDGTRWEFKEIAPEGRDPTTGLGAQPVPPPAPEAWQVPINTKTVLIFILALALEHRLLAWIGFGYTYMAVMAVMVGCVLHSVSGS